MIQVKACRHGRLMFHDNDDYIGRSLNISGVYSEEELQLWEQIIRIGWTVVEVGANIGAHSVWLSKAVGKTGKIIAIEPQRHIYNMLCGNLALNMIKNVYPMLCAMSSCAGTACIRDIDYTKPGNFGGISLDDQKGDVCVIALDNLNLVPHFIKIDVEGMEADVIRGALQTIERHRPVLYVENDRPEKSDELIELIHGLGYRLFWHRPLINRDLFGPTVSINMLCVDADADVTGLDQVVIERDQAVRSKALAPAIEHGAVI
jgi:FkbM family methyltransferase